MADTELEAAQLAPDAVGSGFDPSDYMDDLDHLDMTEAQKTEFLQTLWWIMSAFVDLGFGLDSVIPAFQNASKGAPDTLEETIPKDDFNIAAHEDAKKES